MSNPVYEFSSDLFYFFNQRTYGLSRCTTCEICASRSGVDTPPVIVKIAKDVLTLQMSQKTLFRRIANTIILKYRYPGMYTNEERLFHQLVSEACKNSTRALKSGLPCVITVITEVYFLRYLRLRHHKGSDPCIVYMKGAISCFAFVYDDVLLKMYEDFPSALGDFAIKGVELNEAMQRWSRLYPGNQNMGEIIGRLSGTLTLGQGFPYQSITNKELAKSLPLGFQFICDSEQEAYFVSKFITVLCNKYVKFYIAASPGWNSILFPESNDESEVTKGVPAESSTSTDGLVKMLGTMKLENPERKNIKVSTENETNIALNPKKKFKRN